MKMVRAVVRPEKVQRVAKALDAAGFSSLTKFHVFGRGNQGGIQVGPILYDELAKVMLLLVVADADVDQVRTTIADTAWTGSMGDGKIFVSPVEEVYTIRTGEVVR